MCGIVSVIQKNWDRNLSYAAERCFKQMLFANALRGTDGTGAFWKIGNKTEYNKLPLPSWDAIPKLQDLNKITSYTWIVGHNRKSTMGANTYKNTHPFCEEHVVLVHNGTLTNTFELEQIVGKTEVDSHIITKLLTKYKPKQALEMLEGAYALVWYNTSESKLYFARNEERPLWLLETEDFYFLASEPDLVSWVVARNGLKITKTTEIAVGKIHAFMVNKAKKLQTITTNFTPKKRTPFISAYQPLTTHQPTLYQPPFPLDTHKEKITKWFTPGDAVIFEATSSYSVSGITKIRGKTIDKPVIDVNGLLSEHCKVNLKEKILYEGVISKVEYAFSRWSIVCEDVIPYNNPYQDVRGTILTDRIINQLETKQCVQCKAPVSNDLDGCYVWYNTKTEEHSFTCAKCTELETQQELLYGNAA